MMFGKDMVKIWVFPKIRVYTPKWMIYNGKPYQNGWFGGPTIFGNIHMVKISRWSFWNAKKVDHGKTYELCSYGPNFFFGVYSIAKKPGWKAGCFCALCLWLCFWISVYTEEKRLWERERENLRNYFNKFNYIYIHIGWYAFAYLYVTFGRMNRCRDRLEDKQRGS